MVDEKTIKTDEICTDPHIAHLKKLQLDKLKANSLFNSIGDSCKFIAGPLFGVGIGAAMTAGIGVLSLALLGAASAFLLIGVVSTYAASRVWQDGMFDGSEIAAQSTAHHIAQEIQANKGRADGKTWCQYDAARKAATAQQSQSL